MTTVSKKARTPERPRWRVPRDEVPATLADNFIVEYLVNLSPEQEASIERAETLDNELADDPGDDR